MPRGKVGGEEEGRDGERAAIARRGQRTGCRDSGAIINRKGNGQRQPPEAGGDRPDTRQPHQPRADAKRDAEQQCGEGERVGKRPCPGLLSLRSQ